MEKRFSVHMQSDAVERGLKIMKILLLEDDMELCSSIQEELQKAGYVVDCCYDGETAMIHALHTEYGYDLAVVDRMLPIIEGYAPKENCHPCHYHYGNGRTKRPDRGAG